MSAVYVYYNQPHIGHGKGTPILILEEYWLVECLVCALGNIIQNNCIEEEIHHHASFTKKAYSEVTNQTNFK